MGSITSIAWKGETLVLGDVDGNLNLWDLKAKLSRQVHKSWNNIFEEKETKDCFFYFFDLWSHLKSAGPEVMFEVSTAEDQDPGLVS